MVGIESLLRELNPANDMRLARAAAKPLTSSDNTPEDMIKIGDARIYMYFKPVIRGSVWGACMGALASAFNDSSTESAALYGAALGFFIDTTQFCSRAIYDIFKSTPQ